MVTVALIDKIKIVTWQIIYSLALDVSVCNVIQMKGELEKESLQGLSTHIYIHVVQILLL